MSNDEEPRSVLQSVEGGMNAALEWLWTRHKRAVEAAIEADYLGRLDDEEAAALEDLDEEADAAFQDQLGDWLLAEATLEVGGRETSAADLVLGPGGPELETRVREWLRALAGRPLAVFEVVDKLSPSALRVKDPFAAGAAPFRVETEPEVVEAVELDELLAARTVELEGAVHFGAALFPLEPEDLDELRPIAGEGAQALSRELSGIFLEMVMGAMEDEEEDGGAQ